MQYRTEKTIDRVVLEDTLNVAQCEPTQQILDAWIADVVTPLTWAVDYDIRVVRNGDIITLVAEKEGCKIVPDTSSEKKVYICVYTPTEDGEGEPVFVVSNEDQALEYARMRSNLDRDNYYKICVGINGKRERMLECCYYRGKQIW